MKRGVRLIRFVTFLAWAAALGMIGSAVFCPPPAAAQTCTQADIPRMTPDNITHYTSCDGRLHAEWRGAPTTLMMWVDGEDSDRQISTDGPFRRITPERLPGSKPCTGDCYYELLECTALNGSGYIWHGTRGHDRSHPDSWAGSIHVSCSSDVNADITPPAPSGGGGGGTGGGGTTKPDEEPEPEPEPEPLEPLMVNLTCDPCVFKVGEPEPVRLMVDVNRDRAAYEWTTTVGELWKGNGQPESTRYWRSNRAVTARIEVAVSVEGEDTVTRMLRVTAEARPEPDVEPVPALGIVSVWLDRLFSW